MDGEEGGGIRLSKRFNDNGGGGGGEVDYKTKSGTAWSHSYLNQKPWHPLSYPNQRRKWIAEQTHAHRQRRSEEVAREYAQEQEFFRQTNLISKKDKEKVELMQAVSFMYVRPPGYNAEAAKAAELADEKRKEELSNGAGGPSSSSVPPSSLPDKDHLGEEKKKKPRPKDVFGRPLPTEEEFEILKNAPKLETGVAGRVKPFGVEVRNVKCLRCGNYGHQSGDRECPLKDVIMPNEESRLKRDDPLNAILAHTDPTEPLKWELKQKPGISPPRGGFKPDDPNQQIVAEEIFDEYGGFLGMDSIPDLLTNFSKKPKKSKKSKCKNQQLNSGSEGSLDDGEKKSKKVKLNKKKKNHVSSSADTSDYEKDRRKSRRKSSYSLEDSDRDKFDHSKRTKHEMPKGSSRHSHKSKHDRQRHSYSSEDSDSNRDDQSRKNIQNHKRKHGRKRHYYSSEDSKNSEKHCSSDDSDCDRDDKRRKIIQKHKRKHSRKRHSNSSEDSGPDDHHGNDKSRDKNSNSSDDSNHRRCNHRKSSAADRDSQKHNRNDDFDPYRGKQKNVSKNLYSSEDSDVDTVDRSRKIEQKDRYIPEGSEHPRCDASRERRKKDYYSSKDSGADRYHRYEHSYSSESDGYHHQRHLRRQGHKHR
ncbi:uncharacterized zinc finger CCHC domain-containing protein At4g19190 [Arachis stenosperma]|uniref:uncharacterized zinc finger CCHC domain-containing protein At4g19190 n=1 Tax=Arachis stenosperma TaxID=217475 RepID=UPI0025AD2C4F|nr:uncharacterized zinc finger CCHC domain-containing protein At4g19190 [Arachis stenosperma]